MPCRIRLVLVLSVLSAQDIDAARPNGNSLDNMAITHVSQGQEPVASTLAQTSRHALHGEKEVLAEVAAREAVLSAQPLNAGVAEAAPTLFKPTPVPLPDGAIAHQMSDVVRIVRSDDESQFTMYDVDGEMFRWVKEEKNEHFVQDVFHRSLDRYCQRDMTPEEAWNRSVVIDIGANTGFYGLLALAHGCAVVFVEVQPECNALISKSIEASGFDWEKVKMVKQPLGGPSKAGQFLTVEPWNHCEGMFPVKQYDKGDKSAYGGTASETAAGIQKIPFIEAEDMLRAVGLASSDAIQLVKIDTEGNELQIIEGLLPMLERQRVANLVIEMTPMWWNRTGYTKKQGSKMIGQLKSLGYSARVLDGSMFEGVWVYNGIQEDVWFHHD